MRMRHQPVRERQRHSTTRWNKNRNTTQQHQKERCNNISLRAGQITNYNKIRAVILDYYKTISAFSRSTSAVGTNYSGGSAPMDLDNIWRKGRNYKGKGKGKGHDKENKGKGKYRTKDTTRDLTKGSYNKGGYNKSKGKGYSGSKDYGSSKGYKGQGNYSKSNGKGSNNNMTCHRCGKPGHWAQDCSACMASGEGEELHPLDQEQADQDNNDNCLRMCTTRGTGTTKERKDNTR